jgi:ribosomal protein S6
MTEQHDNPHKEYELAFLVENAEDSAVIEDIIQSVGSRVSRKGSVDQITLSYPIKYHSSAYFGYIRFEAIAELVKDIDTRVKMNEKIIRHLITTALVVRAKASALRPQSVEQKAPITPEVLSNKDLEEKLEEILQ